MLQPVYGYIHNVLIWRYGSRRSLIFVSTDIVHSIFANRRIYYGTKVIFVSLFMEAEWRIYSSINLAIIGSDNGLLSIRRQAIIWPNAGSLLIGLILTNFMEVEVRIKLRIILFNKIQLTCHLQNNSNFFSTSMFWYISPSASQTRVKIWKHVMFIVYILLGECLGYILLSPIISSIHGKVCHELISYVLHLNIIIKLKKWALSHF